MAGETLLPTSGLVEQASSLLYTGKMPVTPLLEVEELKANSKLKPTTEFRFYKRSLPHFEDPGSLYFITFSTAAELELSDSAKDIVFNSIKYHSGKKYNLHACVVMRTHVHLIFQPMEESKNGLYSLAQIMHSIKSYSSNKVNEVMSRKGSVWLDENYDRIIRDDEDYIEKMNYVIYNPVKAGIVNTPEKYEWLCYQIME
jgi:putative transposase